MKAIAGAIVVFCAVVLGIYGAMTHLSQGGGGTSGELGGWFMAVALMLGLVGLVAIFGGDRAKKEKP